MRSVGLCVVIGALVVLGAACTPGGGSGSGTTAPRLSPSVPATVAATVAATEQAVGPGTVLAVAEPTGVPGVDAADSFCAAWAVYGGSLQIISVAIAFSDLDALAVVRLELAAAPSLVDAIDGIGQEWPTELAVERDRVLDDLVGPYRRRAARAVATLRASGLDDAGLAALRADWATVLRTRDPADPAVTLPSTVDALVTALDVAAGTFDAEVTPFNEDPSLVVDHVDVPLTQAYLAERCPDLASSGVGDSL